MSKRKTGFSPEKQTIDLIPPPLTGDDFIDRCFILDFLPSRDDRVGSRMDGLKDVPGLVKQGLLEDAWAILDKYHQTTEDLDFIYAFKALILQKNGQFEAAKKTLLTGLKFGRGKFLLYERLGFLSFESGRLNEAVTWWIKSIVAMKMLNRVIMWEPFLYLAYMAKVLSDETCFRIFMARVKEISPHGELGLDDNALKRMNEKVSELPAPSILKAMGLLCHHYLRQPDSLAADPLSFPESHHAGHPNVPAFRDNLSAFNSFLGKDKKNAWVTRLTITVLALALILFLIQFLKLSEEKPDIKTPAPLPEIRQRTPSVEETKNPLPVSRPQNPVIQATPEKSTAVKIEQEKASAETDSTEGPIPNKERSSFLKSKTAHPDIKRKD